MPGTQRKDTAQKAAPAESTNPDDQTAPAAPEPADPYADTLAVQKAPQTAAERRAELRRELAQLDADSPEEREPEKATHLLILANGDQHEVLNGGSITHVDVGDADNPKPVRVILCTEIA